MNKRNPNPINETLKSSTDVDIQIAIETELDDNDLVFNIDPILKVTYKFSEDLKLNSNTKVKIYSKDQDCTMENLDSYNLNSDLFLTYKDFDLGTQIKIASLNGCSNQDLPFIINLFGKYRFSDIEADFTYFDIENKDKDTINVYNKRKYNLILDYKTKTVFTDISLDKDDKFVLNEFELNFKILSEKYKFLNFAKDIDVDYIKKNNELIVNYKKLIDVLINTKEPEFKSIDLNVSKIISKVSKKEVKGIKLSYDFTKKKFLPKLTLDALNLFRF